MSTTVASAIARNTLIATGARVFSTALSFVIVAIIARTLGATSFGHYTLILSFLFTFQVFADGGLYTLLLRELSRSGVDESRVAGNIITLRLVLLIVVLGVAPFIVWLLPYENTIPLGVAFAGIGFFFLSFSQMFMAIFQKALRVADAAIGETIGRIIQLLVVLGVMVIHPTLFGFLIGIVAGAIGQWIINYYFAHRIVSFRLRFEWDEWKKYIIQASPIAVSAVLVMIYFRIDSIFLSLAFINTASPSPLLDVGYYGVAYKIFEALIFYPAMFVGLLMPFFSRYAHENRAQLLEVVNAGARVLLIVAVPSVIGLIYLAEPIVELVGGVEYSPSAPLVRFLAAALGFVFFGALYGSLLVALDKQRTAAWIYATGAVLNIVANIVAIPFWRSAGAAATTLGTEIIVTSAMAFAVYRVGVKVKWNRITSVIIAGIGMALVLWFVGAGVLMSIVIGGVTYVGLLLLLKGITKKEVLLLFGRASVMQYD